MEGGAKRYYETLLKFRDDEIVNGYRLYDMDLSTQINFETFMRLCDVWDGGDMSDHDFAQWIDENCCTDWNKMDRHGKSFGGFWRFPEDSDEHANAYELSRKDNLHGLCELPYPRRIIVNTIIWGCDTRMESVRFSNFCCEWIRRKRDQMFPSLKTLAQRALE
jgi:hypothetical protein